MNELSKKLTYLRLQNGYNKTKLSQAVGIPRRSMEKWESGTSEPDASDVVKLAKFYGISTDYLLGVVEYPVMRTAAETYRNYKKYLTKCDVQDRYLYRDKIVPDDKTLDEVTNKVLRAIDQNDTIYECYWQVIDECIGE